MMNPRLATRLTILVAIVSILLFVTAIGSAWYAHDLQKSVSAVMSHNVGSVRAAQELEISIREVRTQFDRFLITLDRKHLEPVPQLQQRIEDALRAADAAAATPSEQLLMKRIRKGHDHFFAEYRELLKHPKEALYPKIIDLIDTVLITEILQPAHEYLRLNEGMLSSANQTNANLANRLTYGLAGLGLSGSIGGFLGGWVILASLRRSMLRAEERLRETASRLDRAANPGDTVAKDSRTMVDAWERVSISVSAVLKRLRQTEREVLRAEQLAWVGQMAAGIAHEIRNPLMAIKLLIQATAEHGDGRDFKPRDLQVLEEEIVRLEQIVSGFLDFARPPQPDPRPVDIKELVQSTMNSVRRRAELQGVMLKLEEGSDSGMANVDPNQIRQIVFNLLINALDAQPQGGRVTIYIGLEPPTDLNLGELVLEIEDEGTGLPEHMGDRIFEPFVSTKESGLGLGLSICRRIAQTHGGNLIGKNGMLRGAVFTLKIPISRHVQFPQLANGKKS